MKKSRKGIYGNGYLYQRGDRWYLQTRENGKKKNQALRTQENQPCYTRAEAEQAAALLRAGIIPVPKKKSFAEDLSLLNEQYLLVCGSRLSPAMHYNRAIWMRRLLASFPTLRDVTQERLGHYVKNRLKEKAKSSTINRELSQLRRLLNWAVAVGKIEYSPMKGFRLLPEPQHRERILDDRERTRLETALESFKTHEDFFYRQARLIILIALKTGMRYGEIISLTWSHREGNWIDFAQQEFVLMKTKTRKKRKVPIPQALLEELQALPQTEAWVFPSRRKGIHIDDIRGPWRELLAAAEITGFVFHDLRHTAASGMLRHGADLNTVREILGHASITTTQRYLTALADQKRKAVEWM